MWSLPPQITPTRRLQSNCAESIGHDPLRRPVLLGMHGVVGAAVGETHTCALMATGQVYCWGRDLEGMSNSSTPVLVASLNNWITEIAAGDMHTCARTRDNTVACWGLNTDGQLGNGSGVNQPTPVWVNTTRLATTIRCSNMGWSSCMLAPDDGLWCWGDNQSGILGDGTLSDRYVPTFIPL